MILDIRHYIAIIFLNYFVWYKLTYEIITHKRYPKRSCNIANIYLNNLFNFLNISNLNNKNINYGNISKKENNPLIINKFKSLII